MKKQSLLLASFFCLFFLNSFFVLKFYQRTKLYHRQQSILKEIGESDNITKQFALSSTPLVLGTIESEVKTADGRSYNLKKFFRKYSSDLYPYADLIISESDKNNLDYRVLPAIAMQESSLCKKIPKDSHNCWGWGMTGSSSLKFSDYETAIKTVARGLRKGYIEKGLTTPSEVMAKYAPVSNSWSFAVNHFMKVLD